MTRINVNKTASRKAVVVVVNCCLVRCILKLCKEEIMMQTGTTAATSRRQYSEFIIHKKRLIKTNITLKMQYMMQHGSLYCKFSFEIQFSLFWIALLQLISHTIWMLLIRRVPEAQYKNLQRGKYDCNVCFSCAYTL